MAVARVFVVLPALLPSPSMARLVTRRVPERRHADVQSLQVTAESERGDEPVELSAAPGRSPLTGTHLGLVQGLGRAYLCRKWA
jgi:hypothetical protein